VVLTTDFTTSTTLSPQAQRDSDAQDLGYHYDPIDWAVSERNLNNNTLTLTNGVVLATYGAQGIKLGTGAKL
jgi:hypothetical protein